MACYAMLVKVKVREISTYETLNNAKVCLGFAMYDVQLPDIFLTNFLHHFLYLA